MYSHVAQGKMMQRRRQQKNKSLKQILSTSLKEQFFLLLHKIPAKCDADFSTIFIFVKGRLHKTQNNSGWSHPVLKVINAFRQAINAAIALIFAHSQMFGKSKICSILVFLLAFTAKCLVIFKYLTAEHL